MRNDPGEPGEGEVVGTRITAWVGMEVDVSVGIALGGTMVTVGISVEQPDNSRIAIKISG